MSKKANPEDQEFEVVLLEFKESVERREKRQAEELLNKKKPCAWLYNPVTCAQKFIAKFALGRQET